MEKLYQYTSNNAKVDKVIATTILKNKSRRDETCYFIAFTLSHNTSLFQIINQK